MVWKGLDEFCEGKSESVRLIAQALRQAEDAARNSALEDAAASAAGAALRALDANYSREEAAIAVVVAVRSLKSQEPA